MKTNDELQQYASQLLARAKSGGRTSLRLLGGVAIRRLFPIPAAHPALQRICKDLDFAVSRREAKGLNEVFADCGFAANRNFNALHGETRLMYEAGELQADIFISEFHQCHKLTLEPRLRVIEETLAPVDLLLMKLQVVEMNEKDMQDLCVLLLGAELGNHDSPIEINIDYLTTVTSQDWGWHTTCTDTLKKLSDYVTDKLTDRLTHAQQETIRAKVQRIEKAMEEKPKSIKWKVRNAVGRKVPWYQLPEEARR